MKSETLPEAHARLKAMSDAEKEGAAAASEGQLRPARNPAAEERARQLDEGDPARLEALEETSRSGGDMLYPGTQDEPVNANWASDANAAASAGDTAPRGANAGAEDRAVRRGRPSGSQTRAASADTSSTKTSGKGRGRK